MNRPSLISRLPGIFIVAALGVMGTAGVSFAVPIVVYETDFNIPPYSAGSLNGQQGWTLFNGGTSTTVAATGYVRSSSGTQGAKQLISLPAMTEQIILEFATLSNTANVNSYVISGSYINETSAGNNVWVGTQNGYFGIRANGGPGGSFIYLNQTNLTGDDALTGTAQWFDHRLAIDFAAGTGLWEVSRRDGDGLYTTVINITSNPTPGLGEVYAGTVLFDPANWTLLGFSTNATAGGFDNLSLTATVVPEPSSALLLMLGAVGCAGSRRRRKNC